MKFLCVSLFTFASTFSSSLFAQQPDYGVSIFSPGVVNFVVKSNDTPYQFSAGTNFQGTYGVELGYRFIQNEDYVVDSVQFIAGHTNFQKNVGDDKWSYLGISATFQGYNLYIEPGLTIGEGDYSSPQLTLQAGWIFD